MNKDIFHHFHVGIAKELGLNAAAVACQIFFWSQVNKKNGVHEYEGLYWTKRSLSQMLKAHPYFSKNQLEFSIKKLVSEGVVLSEKWMSSSGDMTNFYTISEDWISKFLDISENSEMVSENSEMVSENSEMVSENSEMVSENSEMYIGEDKAIEDKAKEDNNYRAREGGGGRVFVSDGLHRGKTIVDFIQTNAGHIWEAVVRVAAEKSMSDEYLERRLIEFQAHYEKDAKGRSWRAYGDVDYWGMKLKDWVKRSFPEKKKEPKQRMLTQEERMERRRRIMKERAGEI